MAAIIVLGPSQWKDDPQRRPTPLDVRRQIQAQLRDDRHMAVLLEDFPGSDPPLQDKFEHVLHAYQISHIVVYWPARAKTNTLQQELVIVYGRHPSLRVWLLTEKSVLRRDRDQWIVGESGRGRYTNDVLNAGHSIHEWEGEESRRREVRLTSADIRRLEGG